MDPFDEFEFKPLTDGLGFHKKKPAANPSSFSIEEGTKSKKSLSSQELPKIPTLKAQGLELLDDPSMDPLSPPLPRKNRTQETNLNRGTLEPQSSDTATAVDEILKTLHKNRRLDFENKSTKTGTATAAQAAPTREVYKVSSWSFSASLLDTMLVVAASLLCMIVVLVVTKADLIANLSNPDSQGMVYLSLALVFGTVSFIYLVTNRIFVGCTPGEWAFDQVLGQTKEHNTVSYTLRVVARTALVILTGFVVFPILSLIMNRDLAGEITGARLYRKGA